MTIPKISAELAQINKENLTWMSDKKAWNKWRREKRRVSGILEADNINKN